MLSRISIVVLGGLAVTLAGCARSSIAEVASADERQVAFQGKADPGEAFAFPADKGGKAMSQLLQPTAKLDPLNDVPPGPRPLSPPPGVANPGVSLPRTLAGPPSPPSPKSPVLRPRMMPEGAPLADYRGNPRVPLLRELDTGARIAVTGRDPNQPAPLSLLGLPVYDRVPLDDPTVDASVQAALAGSPPPRTEPVPFAPQNLPDPFANAATVKLAVTPPELPLPIVGPIRTPPPQQPAPAKP
jgi:hypothetical protein